MSRFVNSGVPRRRPRTRLAPGKCPHHRGDRRCTAASRELGDQITADYRGRPPLLIGVLKGAFVFMADLSRAIGLAVEVDFMAVSSYGSATKTSGIVRIVKDLDADLTDRDVIIVEDIVDSGLTLSYLRKARGLLARKPGDDARDLRANLGEVRPAACLTARHRLHRLRDPARLRRRLRGLDIAERYRNLALDIRVLRTIRRVA